MSDVIPISEVLPAVNAWHRLRAYGELTKPRIASLVLVAAMVGFCVSGSALDGQAWIRLAAAMAGIGLVAAGANALNQYLESDFDAQMERTRERPIPSGRLTPFEVLAFGVSVSVVGLLTLVLWVNGLSAVLAGLTLASYVFLYTPLKRVTSLCVYFGAVPGALPPVIGWAAGTGVLSLEAWLLFAILYFWQLPHFAAIAWQYREDYAGAGYPMLSVGDGEGMRTCRHMITHAVALVMASLLPALTAMTGATYAISAMLLGTAFLVSGAVFVRRRSTASARGVVIASVVYLPLLLIAMMIDMTSPG